MVTQLLLAEEKSWPLFMPSPKTAGNPSVWSVLIYQSPLYALTAKPASKQGTLRKVSTRVEAVPDNIQSNSAGH